MTRVIRRHWRPAVAAGAVLVGIVAVLPLLAERAPAPRQVVLVARGMSFVLDGESDPNPTVRVAAGERLEIVLRNETPGIVHDFAIPSWEVAAEPIANGQSTSVTVQVPPAAGRYEYQCRPHSQMMRGVIDVVNR